MKRSKPTIVLLPGTHGNGLLFGPLVKALKGWPVRVLEYPVDTGWDLNGYADWLQDEVKGLQRIILVAESFGSLVAIRYAGQRPRALKGLVTLGGFARNPIGWARPWMRRLLPDPAGWLAMFLGRYLLLGIDNDLRNKMLFDQALGRMSRRDFLDRLEIILNSDERVGLKKIRVPFVALLGLGDFLVSRTSLKDFKNATTRLLAGPHALAMTQEDQIREVIAGF